MTMEILPVDYLIKSKNYEIEKLLKNEDWSDAINMGSSCKMHDEHLLLVCFLQGSYLQSSVKFCWDGG